MTPKTTKSCVRQTKRAQIERTYTSDFQRRRWHRNRSRVSSFHTFSETESNKCPPRFEAVFYSDFLSVGNAPCAIFDRNFVNTVSHSERFGGHFGAEFKAFAPEGKAFQGFYPERLISRCLVGQPCVIKQV